MLTPGSKGGHKPLLLCAGSQLSVQLISDGQCVEGMKPKSCMALSTSCQCPIRTGTSGPSQAAVITLQLLLWPEVTLAHARKQALKSPLFSCTLGIRVYDNPIWWLCHWNKYRDLNLVVKQGKTIISYPLPSCRYTAHTGKEPHFVISKSKFLIGGPLPGFSLAIRWKGASYK